MTVIEKTEKIALAVGDRVRLLRGGEYTRWWDVRAADDRFVVLTRQRSFKPKGELLYTVIDWERGVRGPCNLVGQGWNVEEPGGCDALLRALNAHLDHMAHLSTVPAGVSVPVPDEITCEVSYRNNVPIEIADIRKAA